MNITTSPKARFGWPGQTLEYVVKADGVTALSSPAHGEKGLRVRVLDTRPVGDGIETRVAVDVADGAFY